jgi:hypothetical protein
MGNLKIKFIMNASVKVHVLLFLLFISVIALNLGITSDAGTIETRMYSNNPRPPVDSLHLLQQLIGKWTWDSTLCGKQRTICYAGLYYHVFFLENSEMEVYENGMLIQKSAWKLKREMNGYAVETNPKVENIDGIVFVSNNQVKFRQNDGIKNEYYFSKIF